MAWLYLPGVEDSNSDSPLRSELITEQSPTLKGNVRPLRSWQRTWNAGGWIRLLSGMTLEPSQAMSLAHSWIRSTLSQPGSPVSPGVSQEGEQEPPTTDGSGPTSSRFLGQFTPNGRFLKTSPDFFEVDSDPSSLILPRSGSMMLNGQVFERRMSVRPIAGNASSSWPTARAAEAKGVAYQYDQGDHNKPRLSLTGEAENWPTARANDPEKRGDISNDPRHGLPAIAQHWATPVADEVKSGTRNHQGRSLNKEVHTWATPTASDDEHKVTVNSLQPGLVGEVDRFHGRPVQEALKIGGKLSKSDQTSLPRLNPKFVEWLMGWPQGWLELTGSASSGTE